jgi:hypothetical protein
LGSGGAASAFFHQELHRITLLLVEAAELVLYIDAGLTT